MSGFRQAIRQNWAAPVSVLLHAGVAFGLLVQFSSATPPPTVPDAPSLAVEVMLMPPPPPPPQPPEPQVIEEPPPLIQTTAAEAEAEPPPPPPQVKKKPEPPKPTPIRKKPEPAPEPTPIVESPAEPLPYFIPQKPLTMPTDMAMTAPAGRVGPPPTYTTLISAILEKNKVYPRMARDRRQQGQVRLAFVIDRSGKVLSHEILSGSGYRLLDEEVTSLIQRVSPLPPMPPEMTQDTMELKVVVGFTLR